MLRYVALSLSTDHTCTQIYKILKVSLEIVVEQKYDRKVVLKIERLTAKSLNHIQLTLQYDFKIWLLTRVRVFQLWLMRTTVFRNILKPLAITRWLFSYSVEIFLIQDTGGGLNGSSVFLISNYIPTNKCAINSTSFYRIPNIPVATFPKLHRTQYCFQYIICATVCQKYLQVNFGYDIEIDIYVPTSTRARSTPTCFQFI